MAHKTSWDGSITKEVRKRFKRKSGYARYKNRRQKTGKEYVINQPHYLEIYDGITGKFIRREPKYNSPNGDDIIAKQIYNNSIKPIITRANNQPNPKPLEPIKRDR